MDERRLPKVVSDNVRHQSGSTLVFGNAQLPRYIFGRSSRFHLLQRPDELRLGVLALAYSISPLVRLKSYCLSRE